jgi:ceramide glucosyltransferase
VWGWVFTALAALPAVACLGATVALLRGFRASATPAEAAGPPPSLTMIVPVRGGDDRTERALTALVGSRVEVPVEYLVATESPDDPAAGIAERVRRAHPQADVRIVVTGPAGDRMGKQHNLAVAARQARHEALGSMDADVLVAPDTLAAALRRLTAARAGVVYALPVYAAGGPAGGRLVALYSNDYYQLNMGALAVTTNAPFITGGCWLMSPAARRALGGLEAFTTTVSDDAAIGRAVVAAGLRTELLRRTVTMEPERLGLRAGADHLLKWLTLLRAEGLPVLLAILLAWHPILVGVLATLAAAAVPASRPDAARVAGVAAAGTAVRLAAGLALHSRVLRDGARRGALWLVPYELVAVPVLFARAAFRRHVEWRGTRYRIGRGGRIPLGDAGPRILFEVISSGLDRPLRQLSVRIVTLRQ